ncbi:MAG: thymidine kinase [Saprospiraceae bacterium]
MFLEPHYRGQRSGWIEAICGSMFSGKTEELIRRLRRAEIAGQSVGVFKPETDSRYAKNDVVSHDRRAFPGTPLKNASQVLSLVENLEVVGLDEAQFFGDDLPKVCEELAELGKRVIVAGLDMDFRGKPFGPIPQVLAVAEYITKVHAICAQCGNLATHSFRTAADPKQVLLGADDAYEARCRHCFRMGAVLPFRKVMSHKPPSDAGIQQKLID